MPATPLPAPAVIRGILLMVLAMALLALSDLFVKLAALTLPVGQVMFLLSAGGTLFFILLARIRRVRLRNRAALHPTVLWRAFFEIVAGIGLVLGVAYVPLSIFAAIMQLSPLLVTVGAGLILREHIGIRRWGAVAAGIVGMLLVVRPGMEGFTPAVFFAVLAAVGLAFRDLITRMTPPELPALALSTWCFFATIPTGAILMWLMQTPVSLDPAGLWYSVGGILVTTTGYYAVTTAMRVAPAAVVSPFRYTRLVFTMSLGVIVFHERPDALTLLGAAIIIVAGLYTFVRERQLARRDSRAQAAR